MLFAPYVLVLTDLLFLHFLSFYNFMFCYALAGFFIYI